MSTRAGADTPPLRTDHRTEEHNHVSTQTPEPPEDSFAAFARATGLGDLSSLDASTFAADDDIIGATDDDGDSLCLTYREQTTEDGNVVGVVSVATDGPTRVAQVGVSGMEELTAWLQARIVRAKAVEAGQ